MLIAIIAAIVSYSYLQNLADELPDTNQLRDVNYQIPLSVYSNDGLLIAQFGDKKRIPVDISQTPDQLINAFVAAEDDRFFEHPGVDYKGLLRASIQLALTGKKKQGGSTITMQVVRNFLLTPEKTYKRKIKEIMLALKIERELSKQQILELYLNKIYLGHHAYGVAAAAQIYYDKSLDQLDLAQTAMLAALPKAPSTTNPVTNSTKALQRRNYVLGRMLELGFITQEEFTKSSEQASSAALHTRNKEISAPYIAEMVRNEIYSLYGEKAYSSGLKVYTSINSELQNAANNALRKALHEYDQRHGFRTQSRRAEQSITALTKMRNIGDTEPVWVQSVTDKLILATTKSGQSIEIPWENIKWARQYKNTNRMGSAPKSAQQVIKANDIIRVRKLENNSWSLAQIPEAEGALVSLNSRDGAILALTGGFDFQQSKYNRVTQSKRQPGSGFKPIIYTTALENGYTPASLINDAPVVIDDPSRETEWRPENYSHRFYGPTRLRTALRKSRNLISIRLLRSLGINKTIKSALRFGFQTDQLPRNLSLALGSGYATPLQMARMYAVFANGGFLITPYFIQRIENYSGEILFQATPAIACASCNDTDQNLILAPRIISPQVSFLMNSLLRDVVQRGTATRAKSLGRTDIAGKTGTTNDQRDAWFNGFSPEIATSTWVGLDNSKPLGKKETGGRAALPMWIAYMETALAMGPQEKPLQAPEGIIKAYIDPNSGQVTSQSNTHGVWEFFRNDHVPVHRQATSSFETAGKQIVEREQEEELF